MKATTFSTRFKAYLVVAIASVVAGSTVSLAQIRMGGTAVVEFQISTGVLLLNGEEPRAVAISGAPPLLLTPGVNGMHAGQLDVGVVGAEGVFEFTIELEGPLGWQTEYMPGGIAHSVVVRPGQTTVAALTFDDDSGRFLFDDPAIKSELASVIEAGRDRARQRAHAYRGLLDEAQRGDVDAAIAAFQGASTMNLNQAIALARVVMSRMVWDGREKEVVPAVQSLVAAVDAGVVEAGKVDLLRAEAATIGGSAVEGRTIYRSLYEDARMPDSVRTEARLGAAASYVGESSADSIAFGVNLAWGPLHSLDPDQADAGDGGFLQLAADGDHRAIDLVARGHERLGLDGAAQRILRDMEETLEGPARIDALGRRLALEIQYGDPATAELEVREFLDANSELADADRAGLLLILVDALDKLGSDVEADSIRTDIATLLPGTPEGRRLRKQYAPPETGSPR